MVPNATRLLSVGLVAALLAACGGGGGGGGSGTTPTMPAQTGNVAMLISDASTEDWATIGVQGAVHRPRAAGRRRQRHGVHGAGNGARGQPGGTGSDSRNTGQRQRARRHLHRSGAHRRRQPGRCVAHRRGQSGIGLHRSAGNDDSQQPHSNPTRSGHGAQPHHGGECELRIAVGGDRQSEQRAGSRIRSRTPGVSGRTRPSGRRQHAVGGKLRGTGASPAAA